MNHPSPNEEDPLVLWAEIHRLREALKGPDGFASWQDAAINERVRRVEAERGIREAVLAEREACAKVCASYMEGDYRLQSRNDVALQCAAAIRARGGAA